MRSSSRAVNRAAGRVALALLALALGTIPSASAQADEPKGPIQVEVTVVFVSPSPGKVDPRARKFDRLLSKKLRYGSLRVIESSRRRVALDQVESVKLPSGGRLQFRPLDLGKKGVLLAVEAQGMAQGDFRLRKGKPMILGGAPYEDGQISVILEADY